MRVWAAAVIICLGVNFGAYAEEVDASVLNLTAEQNQKLAELQSNMKAEVDPVWEEIESGRQRILEIEKRYFGEFWNMLTEEQKQKYAKLNESK